MDWLTQYFGESSGLLGSFQMLLDLALIAALGITVFFGKRVKTSPEAEKLVASLEQVVQDTEALAKSFDANLQERQILIQQLLARLDQKVREAESLCNRLESLQREPSRLGSQVQSLLPLQSEHKKVLVMAQKGLNAEAIAKRLKKPLGEVELILNLQRLSSDNI